MKNEIKMREHFDDLIIKNNVLGLWDIEFISDSEYHFKLHIQDGTVLGIIKITKCDDNLKLDLISANICGYDIDFVQVRHFNNMMEKIIYDIEFRKEIISMFV